MVIGIINTIDKTIRLEVLYNLDEQAIKKIINTHIETGNNIISDGWVIYSWVYRPYSGYIYINHIHGVQDF